MSNMYKLPYILVIVRWNLDFKRFINVNERSRSGKENRLYLLRLRENYNDSENQILYLQLIKQV